MPDGGRGFYRDAVAGPAYERHLLEEVIGFVDRTFHTIPERQGRVIGGLSMGGYGAIKLALKCPQLFCSAVAHSAALDVRRRIERPEVSEEMHRILAPRRAEAPTIRMRWPQRWTAGSSPPSVSTAAWRMGS